MTQHLITQSDLEWWLTLAPKLEWIFARTYAESAPHSYVVDGRTQGMSRSDFVRAARVIHTFGRPSKFYAMTSIYLTSPDGQLKWWTMDADVTETNLINQATTDRLYGVQNAPATDSGVENDEPLDALWLLDREAQPCETEHREAERRAGEVEQGSTPVLAAARRPVWNARRLRLQPAAESAGHVGQRSLRLGRG